MYYITPHLPNVVEGGDVALDGLGVFPNGVTTEFTKEQANEWILSQPTIPTDVLDEEDNVVGTTHLIPEGLIQYVKKFSNVDISTTDPSKKANEEARLEGLMSLTLVELKDKAEANNLVVKSTDKKLDVAHMLLEVDE